MRCKGSVTVFAALSLMLITSFLFALLEAGRVHMLEAYTDMTSELALESVCAEYQPALWEEYHLLCLDGAYGGETFSMEYVDNILRQRIDENLSREDVRGTLFAAKAAKVEAEEYQLLTDEEGSVFLNRIAVYMKENFPLEAAEFLYKTYAQGGKIEEEAPVEDSIENAQKAIIEARENQKKEMDTSDERTVSGGTEMSDAAGMPDKKEMSGTSETVEVKENPLEIAMALKQNAILGMVVENVENISTKQVNLARSLLNRRCQMGNSPVKTDVGWQEKVLVLEYLSQYYGDYTSPLEGQGGHSLSYETEYVLCGKETDRANLEGAVKRLMRLRETANAVHIVEDRGKMNEARLLADALAGFTGNPAIIKVVQIGIVGAWAYMESILDVRALLQGDKIALMKSKEEWTLQPGHLMEAFEGAVKAKQCEDGLTYPVYLKLFLFRQRDKLLAYRMMDVMEWNMQLKSGQSHCRMDHMICQMRYRMEYQSETLFLKSHVIGNSKVKKFSYG